MSEKGHPTEWQLLRWYGIPLGPFLRGQEPSPPSHSAETAAIMETQDLHKHKGLK